jgi:uncharacterized protein (TIGR00255 family)
MTGYGHAEHVSPAGTVRVEIRSVNHRYLDVSFRMSRELSAVEEKARALVSSRASRGKIEVSISVEWRCGGSRAVVVDTELARAYCEGLTSLASDLGLAPVTTVEILANLPDVIALRDRGDDPEGLWALVEPALAGALDNLEAMRAAEGGRMERDIVHRIGKIEQTIGEIARRAPDSVEAYRVRLSQRVAEMLADVRVDETRLATEVALFADRCDFTEESVRFQSHIHQFRQALREPGSIGKKLDFLTQEMNREANTIGSKAQDAGVSALVVEVKSELEKIREQVQNIE